MYKILNKDGKAKRAEFHTVHGVIQTPVFMNVGTVAAIKGAVATTDLKEIGIENKSKTPVYRYILKCEKCGHEVEVPRSKAEKNIKQIIREGADV